MTRRQALTCASGRKPVRFEAFAVMAGEGLPVQAATRVLNVTDSDYDAWRGRGPSARAVRHAVLAHWRPSTVP